MDQVRAWDRYYREYSEGLFRVVVSRVGNPYDAEDIVADAFVRASNHLDRLEGDPRYLYKIADNLVKNRYSRARETPSGDRPELPGEQDDSPLEDNPELSAMVAQEQTTVRQALKRLSPDRRRALELLTFGGLNAQQIGRQLGKKPGAVNTLVCRGRLDMARQIRIDAVTRSSMPEACWNTWVPQLSEHLDNQLKSPKRELALAHLADCSHCQMAYTQMQEVERRLRTLVLPFLGMAKVSERIHARLTSSSSPLSSSPDASSGTRRGPGRRPPSAASSASAASGVPLTRLLETVRRHVAATGAAARETLDGIGAAIRGIMPRGRRGAAVPYEPSGRKRRAAGIVIAALLLGGGLVAVLVLPPQRDASNQTSAEPGSESGSKSSGTPDGDGAKDPADSSAIPPGSSVPPGPAGAPRPPGPAVIVPPSPLPGQEPLPGNNSISPPSSPPASRVPPRPGGAPQFPFAIPSIWLPPLQPPTDRTPSPRPPSPRPPTPKSPPLVTPTPEPPPTPSPPSPPPVSDGNSDAPPRAVDLYVSWQSLDTTVVPYRELIVIYNNGPATATGIQLTVSGTGVTLESTSQGTCTGGSSNLDEPSTVPLTCTLGSLPQGGGITLKVRRRIPSSTARVSSAEEDLNPDDNQSTSRDLRPV